MDVGLVMMRTRTLTEKVRESQSVVLLAAFVLLGAAIGLLTPIASEWTPFLIPLLLVGTVALVVVLKCPEVFLGFYLSGMFGAIVYLIPALGDVSGWTALPLLGVVIFYVRAGRQDARLDIGVLLISQVALAVLLWVGSVYSSSPDYGRYKAWQFLPWNLFFMVAPMVFMHDLDRLKRIVIAFAVGSVLFGLGGYYYYHAETLAEQFRLGAFGTSSIWYGRVAGVGALMVLAFMIHSGRSVLKRLALAPVLVGLVFCMVLTGTRGVAAALALSVFVLVALSSRRTTLHRMIALGVVAGVCVVLAVQLAPEGYTARYGQPWEDDLSGHARLEYFRMAWGSFLSSPLFGHGTGSFADMASVPWDARYPHNIFLELMAEVGAAGLLLFCLLVFLTIKYGLRVIFGEAESDARVMMIVLLSAFVFYMAEAQVSGDITGNPVIWFMAGMVYSLMVASTGAKAAGFRRPSPQPSMQAVRPSSVGPSE